MAINFLNKVDYNQNELDHARIVNEAGNVAAGTGVTGQLYFDTTADGGVGVLKVWTNAWVEVGGGVESLTTTDGGTATVNATPISILNAVTGAVTVNAYGYGGGSKVGYVPLGGEASEYLEGDGSWSIPSGTYSLPQMTSTVRGGAELFSNTVQAQGAVGVSNTPSRTYGSQLNSNDQLVVNVPWTDTDNNTSYSIDVPTATTSINLKGVNPTSNDAIALLGGGLLQVTRTDASTLTFSTTATNNVGDVITVTTGNADTIVIGGTTANPTVAAVTSAVINGGLKLATGDQIYDFVTGQIANIPSGLAFEGTWDASTGSAPSASPENGQFWIVSVAGSTSLSGITDWEVGDWAIYVDNGAGTDGWQKVDNTSTLSGMGGSGQVTYWSTTSNVVGEAAFAYNDTSNTLSVDHITTLDGTSANWYEAYNNYVASAAVTGTTTKTMTFTQNDGGTFTTAWTDNNDNTQYTAGVGLTLNSLMFDANVDGVQSIAPTASSSETARTYKVQVDASDNLVVNVPWVDTNTEGITAVNASIANDQLGIGVSTAVGVATVGFKIVNLAAITSPATDDTIALYTDNTSTNNKVTIGNLGANLNFYTSKRLLLNISTSGVTQQASPPAGTIGWVIAGGAVGVSDALDMTMELVRVSDGTTAFAQVTRSGANMTINFVNTPVVAQGDYTALVTRIG